MHHLDARTLAVAAVFVTALLGTLLVFAGLQNGNSTRSPTWWGAAQIMVSLGLGLIAARGTVPDVLSIDIANALVLFGYGLIWAGARIFDGRKVSWPLVALAPVLWLLICRVPAFAQDVNLRVAAVSVMLAALASTAAVEFWRGRGEPLTSRRPTFIVLAILGGVMLARIPVIYFWPLPNSQALLSGIAFTLLAFSTLLFSVVVAFLLLNMTKERSERHHMINSLVDPLSGVANRRGFLNGAARLLEQQETDRAPLALLLFDLDRFKAINDRMGHAVGDRVLKAFAKTATATLGAGVVFGRIGGEEFASLVPVGDLGEAVAIADRVRRTFGEAAAPFAVGPLAPTVSVGVSLAPDRGSDIGKLLEAADRALYRAKAKGRNRVESSAALDEIDAPLAHAPSIVPLLATEGPGKTPHRRRRAAM